MSEKDDAGKAGEEKLAGKYNSQDELVTGYKNLETSYGEQGAELGQSRKTIDLLTSQLEKSNAASAAQANEDKVDVVDYDAQMNDIKAAIESGEMTVADGMAQNSKIVAEMATKNSMDLFTKTQEQNALDNSRNAFSEQHPDFFEVRDQGVLDKIIKESPYPALMDDMSAFLVFDADRKASEAFEKGRTEIADIKKGSEDAASVLAGQQSDEPGLDKLTEPPKTYTDTDLKASMLSAGKKYRSG